MTTANETIAKHAGEGCTIIFTAQRGRDSGFVPLLVLKEHGEEIKRLVLNHMLFNYENDAINFARLFYAHKRIA